MSQERVIIYRYLMYNGQIFTARSEVIKKSDVSEAFRARFLP